MTNHYLRLDKDSNIIHGFSDKFETPLPSDICIREDTERHFFLEIGGVKIYNPPFRDFDNNTWIKYDKDKLVQTGIFLNTRIPKIKSLSEEIVRDEKISTDSPETQTETGLEIKESEVMSEIVSPVPEEPQKSIFKRFIDYIKSIFYE